MSEGRMLRLLIVVAVVHGFIDFVAPVWVVVRAGGADAPVGHGIYLAAVVVLCLTPLQLVFLWFVLGRRLREMRTRSRWRRPRAPQLLASAVLDV